MAEDQPRDPDSGEFRSPEGSVNDYVENMQNVSGEQPQGEPQGEPDASEPETGEDEQEGQDGPREITLRVDEDGTLQDLPDDVDVRTTVNGQKERVPLSELPDGYQRRAAFTRKMQQASETMEEANKRLKEAKEREQMVKRLAGAPQGLGNSEGGDPDSGGWDSSAAPEQPQTGTTPRGPSSLGVEGKEDDDWATVAHIRKLQQGMEQLRQELDSEKEQREQLRRQQAEEREIEALEAKYEDFTAEAAKEALFLLPDEEVNRLKQSMSFPAALEHMYFRMKAESGNTPQNEGSGESEEPPFGEPASRNQPSSPTPDIPQNMRSNQEGLSAYEQFVEGRQG